MISIWLINQEVEKIIGSGIGLSLVKKILEIHKSGINIESKENVGTMVYFELERRP